MCFVFSSRRRHTRYWRDWSSDVCSSDLLVLARKLGVPVKWIEDRSENHLAITHGRGQVQYIELAATSEGKILGMRVKDRKSTRLNSSHANISYAVFCLKKKKTTTGKSILQAT